MVQKKEIFLQKLDEKKIPYEDLEDRIAIPDFYSFALGSELEKEGRQKESPYLVLDGELYKDLMPIPDGWELDVGDIRKGGVFNPKNIARVFTEQPPGVSITRNNYVKDFVREDGKIKDVHFALSQIDLPLLLDSFTRGVEGFDIPIVKVKDGEVIGARVLELKYTEDNALEIAKTIDIRGVDEIREPHRCEITPVPVQEVYEEQTEEPPQEDTEDWDSEDYEPIEGPSRVETNFDKPKEQKPVSRFREEAEIILQRDLASLEQPEDPERKALQEKLAILTKSKPVLEEQATPQMTLFPLARSQPQFYSVQNQSGFIELMDYINQYTEAETLFIGEQIKGNANANYLTYRLLTPDGGTHNLGAGIGVPTEAIMNIFLKTLTNEFKKLSNRNEASKRENLRLFEKIPPFDEKGNPTYSEAVAGALERGYYFGDVFKFKTTRIRFSELKEFEGLSDKIETLRNYIQENYDGTNNEKMTITTMLDSSSPRYARCLNKFEDARVEELAHTLKYNNCSNATRIVNLMQVQSKDEELITLPSTEHNFSKYLTELLARIRALGKTNLISKEQEQMIEDNLNVLEMAGFFADNYKLGCTSIRALTMDFDVNVDKIGYLTLAYQTPEGIKIRENHELFTITDPNDFKLMTKALMPAEESNLAQYVQNVAAQKKTQQTNEV